MATYAIGDIQGCLQPLQCLLEKLNFTAGQDRLWFVGDLVNRGPDSLGTLRFIRGLGESAVTVLGNHDLHLLAIAHGARHGRHDTLDSLLAASDRQQLLGWLSTRPLLHHDAELNWTMIHGGLPPQWTLPQARELAREVETVLRGPQLNAFLSQMYSDEPALWSPQLAGIERLRFVVNCLTRLRYCDAEGRLLLDYKGPPGTQPAGAMPWFQAPQRHTAGHRIVFGHWASLGQVHWPDAQVYGIDTGCVWGRQLSALCLETGVLTSCDCAASAH